jgi:hypothetical protein
MDRLSLNESPANAQRSPRPQNQFAQSQPQNQNQNALGPAGPQPTGGPPQLPPQMFTTAAQLLDLTDSTSAGHLRGIAPPPIQTHRLTSSQRNSSSSSVTGGNSSVSYGAGTNLVCLSHDLSRPLSYIHAANLVFQETIERVYAGQLYADVPRGIFIVRGENVLLLGEVVSWKNSYSAASFLFYGTLVDG